MSSSFCLDMNNNTSLFAKQINGFSSPKLPSNGFSIRPAIVPIFAFSPKNTKFNRTQILFRANSSQSVGFEVEFKPNFDDYLKAMESVKTVREKRSKNKTEGQNGNLGDSVRDDRKVARGENEKWIKDHSNKVVKDTGFNRDDRKFVHGENVKWIKDHSNTVVKDTGLNRDNSRVVYGDNVRWIKDRSITTEEDKGTIHNSVRTENYKNNTGEEDHGNHERFVRNSAYEERKFVYGKNERWVKDKSYSEEGNGNSRGSAYDTIRGGNSRGSAYDTIRGERNSLYGKNERLAKDKGYSKEGNWNSRGSFRNSIRDKGEIVHDKNVRRVKNKGKISEEDYEGYSSGDENSKVNERKVLLVKDVRGSKYNGNGGVEDEVNGGSFRNWNRNEPSVKESKFGVKSTKQFDTHGRNVRWEEKHGNNTFVKEKDYGFKVGEDRINGSEIMFGRNARWEENQAKWDSSIEKDRFLRVDKDKVRGRNKYGVEESDGDEEVGSERAAFKPMGGVDDVVDKPRISRNEMEDRIQKLARSLHGADVNMPEWMFSKMIRSARIRFSDHSILRIVQLLGKLGNWRRVLQLIDWLQSRERFNSHKLRFIYTTALSVLGKARRPVEALNLFQTMQQQFSTYPDLVAYHSIAVTLGQAGHMRELFEVIDIMKSPPKKKFKNGILEKWDPRLEPDIVVYNAVLNACVKRKQWEGAFWVLQQLQDKGQHPSGTTYGLVMEIMLACGKYNLVHDFYKKVLKSSIPNAITYKVLVNTLWREGKADEAVLAVEDMEKRGVVGSAALYYDLARCLCSAGRCQEALTQVEKICRVANKPLVVTYTGLMQACLDAGNIEDGTYIYRHMQKFCSPNLVTCNIILKAYIEYGKFEEAKILFHKLLEDGKLVNSREDYKERVIPDTYTFNTMLDACIEEKRWDEFEFVFKGMLEYGHPFNAKRHLRMILDVGRAGKGELLETTWNYLIRNSQIPLPHSLLKEMFCIKLEQGKYAVALSYISNHNPTNIKVFSSNSWLNFFKENAHRLQKDCLLGLVHEVSLLTSESDAQNLVLQNLGLACTEFLKMRISVTNRSHRDSNCPLLSSL